MVFQSKRQCLVSLLFSTCWLLSGASGAAEQQTRLRRQRPERNPLSLDTQQDKLEERAVKERGLRWSWSSLFHCIGPLCHKGGDDSSDGSSGSGSSSSTSSTGTSGSNKDGSGNSANSDTSGYSSPDNFADKMRNRFDIVPSGGGLRTAGAVASLTTLFLIFLGGSVYTIIMLLTYAAAKRERWLQEPSSDSFEPEDSLNHASSPTGESLKGAVARRMERMVSGKQSIFPMDISGAPRFISLADLSSAFPTINKDTQIDGSSTSSKEGEENEITFYREMEGHDIEMTPPRSVSQNAGIDVEMKDTEEILAAGDYGELADDTTPKNATEEDTDQNEEAEGEAISNYVELTDEPVAVVATISNTKNEKADEPTQRESADPVNKEDSVEVSSVGSMEHEVSADCSGVSKTMQQLKLVQKASRILREIKL